MAFVTTRGVQFSLEEKPFFFAGTNNYYLSYKSRFMVDAALDSAQALGLPVIRAWGFLDIASPPGVKEGVYFHYWDAVSAAPAFNDGATGLEHLDYVIDAARQRGLRLILPLVNNWADFGGVDQYNAWYELTSHQDFFIDPRPRQAYKDCVSHVVNRTNTINGLQFKNDDTILAWELGNELRCPSNPVAFLNWAREMSAFLKANDPNHLIGVGDEGFFNRTGSPDPTYNDSYGADFEAFLGIPAIDFGAFHLYPEKWGQGSDFGGYWIRDHIDACARANKPALLEEFGIKDQAARDNVYRGWLQAIYNQGGAADLFWMLAAEQDDGTLYPDFDGFTLHRDSVPQAILTHIASMRARNG
jgi:mannan endo-1,4-beta-mannosidase